MRILGLLRHAKSSWHSPGLADFDRPLKPRGEKAAKRMGAELASRNVGFDRVLASPARRVVETLAHFEAGFGRPVETGYDRRIYEASAHNLLDLIRQTDDADERLMLVGHQPALQHFATMLAADETDLYGSVSGDFPTTAFVLLELPAKSWRDVELGTGRIAMFLKPRELE